MCRATTCNHCDKVTWAGCGMHVDQVLAGVPRAQRCDGHRDLQRSNPMSSFRSLFRREA